ncbi:MAG TPA: tetraacyldisaccharide 4'-kinase [Solimonas sp.]|nr:tetraacyldisaccharide 4'-kinase [Solimonas sp.]
MPTRLESRWYADAPPPALLRPLAALYGALAARHRRSVLPQRLPVPVVVVGNISVGGTGKTPLTIWLVERLREWGYAPGVISRGYGGRAPRYPLRVDAATAPELCGDEPALIARRLGCPLAVAPDRVAAGRMLVESGEVNVLVADDGLQHYRLARDVEICVVDGARGLGNGALLPAGPLRELPARLREVDLVVVNGGAWRPAAGSAPVHDMQLTMDQCRALAGREQVPLSAFYGQRVHAVAGIGNPQRFFQHLRAAGIQVLPHPFPDHHAHRPEELRFGDSLPVLMTEKDAVKCATWAGPGLWCVPVTARLAGEAAEAVRNLLAQRSAEKHG